MKNLSQNKKAQLGQGMTEYIIIVALIAVSAIGVYSMFGKTIRNQVAGLSQEVAGVSNTGTGAAATSAGDAATAAKKDKGMSSYGADTGGAPAAAKP